MKTKTYYQIDHMLKSWTEDDYEKGEIGQTSECELRDTIAADTATELIKAVCDLYALDEKDLLPFGETDEPDRIEFSRLETDDTGEPSEYEKELWKLGEKRLWNATYTGFVKRIVATDGIDLRSIHTQEGRDNESTAYQTQSGE